MATKKQVEHYEKMLADAKALGIGRDELKDIRTSDRAGIPVYPTSLHDRVAVDDTLEAKFERLASEMGLHAGVMAQVWGEPYYLNEHVQWLWEQFQRKNN